MSCFKIKLITDGIIFKFVEETSGGTFKNKTSWGFIIKDKNNDIKSPRWGLVTHIGPDVKYAKVGQYILIEPLQWTNKLIYNGDIFWKTNESKVIMVSSVPHV